MIVVGVRAIRTCRLTTFFSFHIYLCRYFTIGLTSLHISPVGIASIATVPTPIDLLLEPIIAVGIVEVPVPGADLGHLEVDLQVALQVVTGRLDGRVGHVGALSQGRLASGSRVLEGEVLAAAPGRPATVAAALLDVVGLGLLLGGGDGGERRGDESEGQVDEGGELHGGCRKGHELEV